MARMESKKADKALKTKSAHAADDDIFDRAVTGMLRSTPGSRHQPSLAAATLATDFNVNGLHCGIVATASESRDVKEAVAETWRKANIAQELAVETAVKAAVKAVEAELFDRIQSPGFAMPTATLSATIMKKQFLLLNHVSCFAVSFPSSDVLAVSGLLHSHMRHDGGP